MDPLIKSQLLYQLSYAPSEYAAMGSSGVEHSRAPRGLPLALPLVTCPAFPIAYRGHYQKAPASDRRKVTFRLTWALSTNPSPIIMVSIEVPP